MPIEVRALSTPDITPAQLAGYGAAAVGVVAGIGLDVPSTWRFAGIVAIVVALVVAHLVSDAVIRQGRAKAAAAGAVALTETPPELDPTPRPRP